MQRIYIDFETVSEVDINNVNASVYARHKSTDALCAVLISEDGRKIRSTDLRKDRPLIEAFIEGKLLVAHNAIFEQLIWQHVLVEKYGYKPRPVNTWRCTRAKAQAHSLPGSLEKCAEALDLLQQKDMGGKRLMLKMCKPGGPRDAESMQRLVAYCEQDVKTTIAIDKSLPCLSVSEQRVWELDQEINWRGVGIDKYLVQQVIRLLEDEKRRLTERFEYLVQGQVKSPKASVGLKTYLQSKNFDINSVNAKEVKKLLSLEDLPDDIRELLEIRKILAKSSTAKYTKILQSLDSDSRLRENLVYHGAGTGRWTGQGAQLQNLPRPKRGFDPERAISNLDIADISWPIDYGSVNEAASSLLRSIIWNGAYDHVTEETPCLIGGDYAGIEARITPWIAGQDGTLDVFRRNEDIYLHAARDIYNRVVHKADVEERQVGKCAVLGLGYQGGIAAFYKMCNMYNVSLAPVAENILASATADELEKAQFVYEGYVKDARKQEVEYFNKTEGLCADIIKQRWRAKNSRIVQFWTDINNWAVEAVLNPKAISFIRDKKEEDGGIFLAVKYPNLSFEKTDKFLYIILPSGRKIAYYKPKVQELTNKFGVTKKTLTYISIDPMSKQLVQEKTYGGKLTENIVQAIARDIMANGMFNVKNYGLDIVLTVHDEILSEYRTNLNEEQLKGIENCFTRAPEWAKGLPLAAEIWCGSRYRK